MNLPPEQRLRVTFGKQGALVYVGHLDTARIWERIARRAGLPLAYSHGFNPRPRIQLADALAVGISSACELVDLYMKTPVAPDGLAGRLEAAAPPGLKVYRVTEAPLKAPALQALVAAADYSITFPDGAPDDLAACVADFMAREHVEHVKPSGKRQGEPYNLRALVRRLEVTPGGTLEACLSLGPGQTARPDALLDVLGLCDAAALIHRTALHLA
ncbi:MAG: DUF2344 domain-containing protein [Anaerolineae bacterium]|nr:DUF2344 domain-containing protein [Anaerolineae bacterium]